jgi:hypothetical protein
LACIDTPPYIRIEDAYSEGAAALWKANGSGSGGGAAEVKAAKTKTKTSGGWSEAAFSRCFDKAQDDDCF